MARGAGQAAPAVAARQSLGDVLNSASQIGLRPAWVAARLSIYAPLAKAMAELAPKLEEQDSLRGWVGNLLEAADVHVSLGPDASTRAAKGVLASLTDATAAALDDPERRSAALGLIQLAAEDREAAFPERARALVALAFDAGRDPGELLSALKAATEVQAARTGLEDAGQLLLDLVAGSSGERAAPVGPAPELVAGWIEQADQHSGTRQAQRADDEARVEALAGELEARLAGLPAVWAEVQALPPAARRTWLESLQAKGEAEPDVLRPGASLDLALLQRDPAAPRAGLDAAATALSRFLELGLRPETMTSLGTGTAASVAPDRVAEVLGAQFRALSAVEGAAERLATVEPHLLVDFGRALVPNLDRLAPNGALIQTLSRVLGGAGTPAAIQQALTHGVAAAAAIPDVENGPARELLQAHLPSDLSTLAEAGVDHGELVAEFPKLPTDSLARFAAIALAAGETPKAWLRELEGLFKGCRGNMNHVRTLRGALSAVSESGADAVRFSRALAGAKLAGPIQCRTVEAFMAEAGDRPSAEAAEAAVQVLEEGGDLLQQIGTRTTEAMMTRLGMRELLEGGDISVSQDGLKAVEGPLQSLFKNGAGRAEVNQDILKGLLVAVLEGRADGYRFETPVAETQLQSLNAEQRAMWMAPRSMTHIRLDDAAKARFLERVGHAAKVANMLAERMEDAWGTPDALAATLEEATAKLRDLPKNATAKRKKLIASITGLPPRLEALRWAKEVASLDEETVTPEIFLNRAQNLDSMFRTVGPAGADAVRELMWTMRLGDIPFTEVVSNDGPSTEDIFKVSTTNCLSWPGYGGEALSYAVDPNKRMVMTKNATGEPRRAVLRLAERLDEGHEGQPILLLERTYPDTVSHEEKQRLVEHTLRRASEMGIACGFATEYYWDASKTQRRQIIDMNAVIEDLSGRYDYTHEKKVASLRTRGGNMNIEYLDSAPWPDASTRGQPAYRGHPNRYKEADWQEKYGTDKDFENEFVILSPRG